MTGSGPGPPAPPLLGALLAGEARGEVRRGETCSTVDWAVGGMGAAVSGAGVSFSGAESRAGVAGALGKLRLVEESRGHGSDRQRPRLKVDDGPVPLKHITCTLPP